MSLADRTLVDSYARQGPRCFFERLLDELDQDDADTLVGWLDDPRVASADITRALRDEGYQLGPSTTQRHRRGDCRCSR